jgi:serine protease Do
MAMRIMNSLITEGRVIRGWLGIAVQDIDEQLADALDIGEIGGALVGDVLGDSPAEKAGLEPGDVIIALDGNPVKNSAQLRNHIASTPPETVVRLTVIRDDERKEIGVELGELPTGYAQSGGGRGVEDLFGFTVETLTRDLADRYGLDRRLTGVLVTSIDPESGAYRGGLREGDLIRSLNRQNVQDRDDFAGLAGDLQKGDTVLLRIHRDGSGFFVAFVL